MDTEIRRYENNLAITGLGTIAFGIWSIIKTLLSFYLDESEIMALIDTTADEVIVVKVTIVLIFVALAIDLALRLYTGLRAVAEGRGRKSGKAYIVISGILALVALLNVIFYCNLPEFIEDDMDIVDRIVAFIFEASIFITQLELMVSAIKLKKLQRGRQV